MVICKARGTSSSEYETSVIYTMAFDGVDYPFVIITAAELVVNFIIDGSDIVVDGSDSITDGA